MNEERSEFDRGYRQAVLDAEYLGGMDWGNLTPPVLRWIASRVALITQDPDVLRELGTFDPYSPGATKVLGDVQGGLCPFAVGDVVRFRVKRGYVIGHIERISPGGRVIYLFDEGKLRKGPRAIRHADGRYRVPEYVLGYEYQDDSPDAGYLEPMPGEGGPHDDAIRP